MGDWYNNSYALSCMGPGEEDCTCDFRINLRGCPEETNYKTALSCLVPFTSLVVIISISFIYYRVKVKGQPVFFPATRERGMIRPRPQDSFHIAVGIFNFMHTIVLICVLKDLFDSAIVAETVVYIPKLLGFTCAVLYPISIIYSTPIIKPTTYYLRLQWNPSKHFIDGLAFYLMLGPILTTVPLSILTGYYADKRDPHNANTWFVVHTFVWSGWTVQYSITLLYVYYKLICMLKEYIHLLKRRQSISSDTDAKIRKLHRASHSLTWIVFAVLLTFLINSLEGILVGISYRRSLTNPHKQGWRFTYFFSWNFTIPILTFTGQLIFLYEALKEKRSSKLKRYSSTRGPVIPPFPSSLKKPSPVVQKDKNFSIVNRGTTEGIGIPSTSSVPKSIAPYPNSLKSKNRYNDRDINHNRNVNDDYRRHDGMAFLSKSTKKRDNPILPDGNTVRTETDVLSMVPETASKASSSLAKRNLVVNQKTQRALKSLNSWKISDFDIKNPEDLEESENDGEDSVIITSDERISWLGKKPLRRLSSKINDNLFLPK